MACSEMVCKIMVFITSVILIVVGLLSLGAALYLVFGLNLEAILNVTNSYSNLGQGYYIAFVIVGLLIITGAVGILGVCMKKKVLIFIYVICVFISIVLTVAGTTYVIAMGAGDVEQSLMTTLDEYQSETATDEYSIGWNVIQSQFKRCGVNDAEDWLTSTWTTEGRNTYTVGAVTITQTAPLTCCSNIDFDIVKIAKGEYDFSTITLEQIMECYGVEADGTTPSGNGNKFHSSGVLGLLDTLGTAGWIVYLIVGIGLVVCEFLMIIGGFALLYAD